MSKTPAEYDVEHWRNQFESLLDQMPKRGLARELSQIDDYYSSSEGYFSVKNVKQGRGSISTTKRVVLAMNKYLARKAKRKKTIQRQKIQTVND